MPNYFKLYRSFVRNSILIDLQYRSNFFLFSLASLGWGLVYIFLYVFIFNNIDKVGDWTYERSLVLAATFLIVNALNKVLFEQNLKRIVFLVYQGDLDLILAKPLSSQFLVSLRQFSLKPFLRFILSWLILGVVLYKAHISINLINFLGFLFMLFISTIIIYSLWFMSCCLVFWLGNIENIYQFFHPVLRTTALPFDILPGILNELMFFVIPLVFIATIPAKTLLGLVSFPTILYGVFIAGFLLYLSHRFWSFCLRHYSSASS